ncbi:1-acylglycerol-3-phosphate acyltransferase [Schizosaccharomyces cryophilus OY26]|uniref:1-acylglycerol-3-phosphate acyltransferase n=1 Tax=Schizosaccharomyces cryophilus (strain OY26 / ATCC MYA-4695 / CBS 11777 / NBRC 106824 / NRRL Y48691) TaxID=653667 RepID=S9VY11_SCHCR|nr:1-acylglycerol-3-phosphate acyltransferase [Schizosaccharomyces cryophilus OY26]EPY51109.1 1-acylglycerol-3-phosphate acyltransferase [Schizosaccharomyces cryophilus OY26]
MALKTSIRKYLFILCFAVGTISIYISEVIGIPLNFINTHLYNKYVSFTKGLAGILFIFLIQSFSPTPVTLTYDSDLRNLFYLDRNGCLETIASERNIVMANHQLYSDWMYIWWLAYTAKLHGHIYIVLKDSLKWIPIIGWGMQLYRFIFLSRKWDKDASTMERKFNFIHHVPEPASLLMFPEGTNLVQGTWERSKVFADKAGVDMPKNLMLPRVRGLFFSISQLRDSMTYLYDYTFAFSDPSPKKFAADAFSLKQLFFEGARLRRMHVHARRFRISDIPSEEKLFTKWLYQRWYEKDQLIEDFRKNGSFPGSRQLNTTVRLKSRLEILYLFSALFTCFAISFVISLFL